MIWLFFWINSFALATPPSEILIQSPESSSIEYEARLTAGDLYTSPERYYRQTHPALEARDNLLKLFAEAQQAFLQAPGEESRRRSKKVYELLETEDWGGSERELILISLLRLAQMAEDSNQRDLWLRKTLWFGTELTTDHRNLFPPPLLARQKELRDQASFFSPRHMLDAETWDGLLINGMHCTASHCPEFPRQPETVRVTFLSNKWLPQTLHIDLRQLSSVEPPRQALASGACGRTDLHPKARQWPAGKKVFFSLHCPLDATEPNLQPSSPSVASVNLIAPEASPKNKFYKSPWFWSGVAGLAVVFIARAAESEHQHKSNPTTTYGY